MGDQRDHGGKMTVLPQNRSNPHRAEPSLQRFFLLTPTGKISKLLTQVGCANQGSQGSGSQRAQHQEQRQLHSFSSEWLIL